MNGQENLIPVNLRTKEEQREITRKGGIASGEARRRKRDSRVQMLELLKCIPELDEKTKDNLRRLGFKGKGPNKDKYPVETIGYASLLQRAMKGDVNAHRLIQEMIGEDAQSKRQRAQMEHEKEIAAMMSAEAKEDDGFMDALADAASEVFDGGVDEPSDVETTLE